MATFAVTVAGSRALHPSWWAVTGAYVAASPVAVDAASGTSVIGAVGFGGAGTGVDKKVAKAGGSCTAPVMPRGAFTQTAAQRGTCQGGARLVGAARKLIGQTGRLPVGTVGRHGQVVTGPFTHVTVTRDYDLATGAAPTGRVVFTPSAWLVNSGVVVPAAEVVALLDVDGVITIDLAANTDPGTDPSDSHYTVREEIVGQPRRAYTVVIPHNAGSTVDLTGLGGATGYGTSGYGTSGYGL